MATQFTPADMVTLATDAHSIDLSTAGGQTRAFRNANPGGKIGGIFNKQAVMDILNQNGCVGLRYYFGITNVLLPDSNIRAERNPTLILCGVKANGNDMETGLLAEQSWACPPHCSAPNSLNS